MNLLNTLAEENIRQAAERGEFDNLPGAGKPLQLDDDRNVPPELRVGYRILKNSGFLPPEIQLQRELRSAEDLLAASLPDSVEHSRAQRRLDMLRLRLAESRHGAALLGEHRFQQKLLQKLTR